MMTHVDGLPRAVQAQSGGHRVQKRPSRPSRRTENRGPGKRVIDTICTHLVRDGRDRPLGFTFRQVKRPLIMGVGERIEPAHDSPLTDLDRLSRNGAVRLDLIWLSGEAEPIAVFDDGDDDQFTHVLRPDDLE